MPTVLSKEQIRQRWNEIEARAETEKNALKAEVLSARIYPDGCRVRRIRYYEDGSVYDDITGVIVGADVFLYSYRSEDEPYPNVQYWVRIETPVDYNTHQQCSQHGLELGKAQDFWQGDKRWTLIEN